jgi:hypothetical protein
VSPVLCCPGSLLLFWVGKSVTFKRPGSRFHSLKGSISNKLNESKEILIYGGMFREEQAREEQNCLLAATFQNETLPPSGWQ